MCRQAIFSETALLPHMRAIIRDQRAILGVAPLSRLLRDHREWFNQLAMETRAHPQQYRNYSNVIRLGALLRIISPMSPRWRLTT
jgi:hypothetical protein